MLVSESTPWFESGDAGDGADFLAGEGEGDLEGRGLQMLEDLAEEFVWQVGDVDGC